MLSRSCDHGVIHKIYYSKHQCVSKAAFTPGQHVARQHAVGNICPVAVKMLLVYWQQNCYQFIARLLLDTKGCKSIVT